MNRIALGRTMGRWAWAVAAAGLLACGSEPQPKTAPLTADPPLDEGQHGQVQGSAPGAAGNELQRGIAYIKNEKYDDAIAHLTKAIETNPKSTEAHFYMGLAKEKKGDRAGAEQSYKAALDIDSSFAEAAGNLAAIYLDDPPRPDLAIGVLENALKKAPDSSVLLQNLAYAYNLKNDVDNAAKYYEAAIAKGDSTDLRFALGVLLAQAKRYDNALPHLKKALAGMGDKPDELATLGGLFWFAKAYAECVSAFDRAIKIKATEAEWFTRRGTCRGGLKDDAGSMADYQSAVKADPKFAPAHYYLAIGMITKKDFAGAESELKLAVQHGGDSPIGKSAKDKLAEIKKQKH